MTVVVFSLPTLDDFFSQCSFVSLYHFSNIPTSAPITLQISQKERGDAQKLFSTAAGQALLTQIDGAAAAGGPAGAGAPKGAPPRAPLTDSQKRQVRLAIQNAKTKEEIDHIELQLKTGTFMFEDEAQEGEAQDGEGKAEGEKMDT